MKMNMISLGVVKASPRTLQVHWSIESLEEGLKSYKNKADDYNRIAKNFLIMGYNTFQYISQYGGASCTGGCSNRYRPQHTIEVKVTAWYIELYGEDYAPAQ